MYVVASVALRLDSPIHALSRVYKLTIHLSKFEFYTDHVEGSNNVLADLLKRLLKGYQYMKAETKSNAAMYGDIRPHSTGMTSVLTEDVRSEERK